MQMKPSIWCPGFNASDPLAQGMAAYWPLWDGDGSRAMDLVGGHHGDLVGSPTWIGDGVNLSGANQWINTGASWLRSGDNDFTIWARCRLTGTSGDMTLFSDWTSEGVLLRYDATSNRWELYYTYQSSANLLWSDTTMEDGDWHDVAIFANSDIIAIVFDGVIVASQSTTGTYTPTDGGGFYIGSRPNEDTEWIGDVAAVAGWRRTLSPGELASLSLDPYRLIRHRTPLPLWTAATQGGGAPPTPTGMAAQYRRRIA